MGRPLVLVAGKDPLAEVSGGHSRYVRVHARAAAGMGFEPHVFCASPRPGTVQTEFGVLHRVWSPFRPVRQILVAAHAPFLTAAVVRFLRAAPPPHLVHGFGVWGHVAVQASRRLARRGIPVAPVVSSYTTYAVEAAAKARSLAPCHGRLLPLAYRTQHRWVRLAVLGYERRGYEGAALVLHNYAAVRRLLLAAYRVETRCRQVPYTSETAFREEAGELPGKSPVWLAGLGDGRAPLVVSVARHDPRKGGDILLEALARLRAAGVSFRACLVGGGPLLGAHRRLAAALGLDGQVTLPGAVPDAFAYLRRADVFALASREEQSGSLALIEALQAALPAVVTGVDGIPEDVTDGEDALLVPPGDAGALARALARLLADPALRAALGHRARQTFERRFSARACTEGLREAYATLGVVP